MSDSPQNLHARVKRREPVKLPSIWLHLFWALSTLMFLAIGGWAFLKSFGNETDAVPKGIVQVETQPLPPQSDSLAGSASALPDLLEGDVPNNINPTETLLGSLGSSNENSLKTPEVDALGNPINNDANNSLVGVPDLLEPELDTTATRPAPRGALIINGEVITPAVSLPPAPIGGLSRQTAFGPAPGPNAQGLSPHTLYARPKEQSVVGNPVSIIIGGLGINRRLTQTAIDNLPANITLSFAAHAPGLQSWINKARVKGHEVLLEIPMESEVFDSAEAGASRAMRVSANTADNLRNLDWLLSRAHGYFALTNYNGDKFLNRTDKVVPFFDHLKKSGLGFYFDGASSAPSLPIVAQSANLPFTQAYNIIDNTAEASAITAELSRLQARASAGQTPIGIGFAFPETIRSLQSWLTTLDDKGLVLVPASSSQIR